MFDIGWAELLVIAIVAVLAIGPKEMPQMMRALGRMLRRINYARFAISRQFEDLMREEDEKSPHQSAPPVIMDDDEADDDNDIHAPPARADEKAAG